MIGADWSEVFPPGAGKAFRVRRSQLLRIEQVEGGQVADFTCFASEDPTEHLSPSNTIMYNLNLNLTPGSPLYSNRSRVMLRLVTDTVGANNLFLGGCSLESYRLRFNVDHPNCMDILEQSIREYGIPDLPVQSPINFFMNWPVHADGSIEMGASRATAGDHVELMAELELVVALSVCPQELTPTNGFNPRPLRISVGPQPTEDVAQ